MAELRVRTIDESELETVLAEDLEFEGTIEYGEPLLVKGKLSGEVRTQSDLYISTSAVLDADVHATRVSVRGTVRGDIHAMERIELFSGGSIGGNIRTPDLIMQSGSHFTGTCTMDAAAGAPDPSRTGGEGQENGQGNPDGEKAVGAGGEPSDEADGDTNGANDR